MHVRVGTSGYSYPQWRPSFYPEGLKDADMLAFYAGRFASVEINNTFYRMPKADVLARWAQAVSPNPDFVFVLKAPQRLTHTRRLVGAEVDLAYLLETAQALGPRLGPILFQLPPFLKADIERLRAFLALVPRAQRVAFEFRHESWNTPEVQAALRDFGAALVCADTDESVPEGEPIVPTADWGYLRLRRVEYDTAALQAWAARLRAQPWREAFVFFKHEDEGKGPALAAGLLAALGSGPRRLE